MAKKTKSKKSKAKKVVKIKQSNELLGQKFALLLFGIGPILIVGWFLFSKGFFDSP